MVDSQATASSLSPALRFSTRNLITPISNSAATSSTWRKVRNPTKSSGRSSSGAVNDMLTTFASAVEARTRATIRK